MRALSILYHDVVEGDWDASGFPGEAAARYKMTVDDFDAHLAAISEVDGTRAVVMDGTLDHATPDRLLFTVDDGGISSLHIAERLERHGWLGHFFITTDRIGTRGFLSATEVRDLRARGHVIGSHSASHPAWMSAMPFAEARREWQESVRCLADILGEPVTVASVPGGYYSAGVAKAAAEAGIGILFNSEPTTRVSVEHGCTIVGRYTVYRGMPAATAAALVAGTGAARLAQSASWSAKKSLKTYAGPVWTLARSVAMKRQAARAG